VFTPKGKIMAMPRGATVMDFAYAIHSGVGHHAVSCRINGEQRALRSELSNGDVVEIVIDAQSEPSSVWLSFVKTGRARSKIRHHFKTAGENTSLDLGRRMLAQALRSEGLAELPSQSDADKALWDKLLRFTGNRSVDELLSDIGMGKRIASMVAKKLAVVMSEAGHRPDPLLISTARFSVDEDTVSQGVLTLDGSEGHSVQYASCCKPIPGDGIVGYLGRGESLMVHTDECPHGKRLLARDSERFLGVEWSEEPTRAFETGVLVTVANGKGVLARVSAAVAAAEADITHVDMGREPAQSTTDLVFTLAVRDRVHLAEVLRTLKRTPSVIKAQRAKPART